MGLFGGGSSSQSTVVNEVSNVTQGAQDGGLLINLAGGDASGGGSSTSIVNFTDSGSIAGAFEFGARALNTSEDAINRALTFAQRAGDQAFDSNNRTVDRAFDTTDRTVDKAFKFGQNVFSATSEALSFAQRAGDNALKFAFDAGRPNEANTRIIVYVAGGVAALFVVMSVINNKKSGAKK